MKAEEMFRSYTAKNGQLFLRKLKRKMYFRKKI